MAAYSLLKPELYAPRSSGNPFPGEACVLKGGRCLCGHVYFPLQDFGCEDCGAYGDLLKQEDLAGTGTLVAAATVHVHKNEDREAPFVVAAVRLDAGPVVRTLLEWPPEARPPAPGTRVSAVLLPASGDFNQVLDLRFRTEREGGSQ